MDYYGKTILITGASSGIGKAYAEKFASLGCKLVLVARSEPEMTALAETLRHKHSTESRVISLDLSDPAAAIELLSRVPAVDGLINNAGFGTHGLLQDLDPGLINQEIRLNCGTLVDLTQRYLPGMLAKREGLVINIASTAAFQPLPKMAVYGATKAFVLSFTQALWAELQSSGVQALAVCPGATSTKFFEVAGEAAAVGTKRSVDDVIDTTFKGLQKNAHTVVDGGMNAVTAFFGRIGPRRLVMSAVNRMMSGSNHQ